MSLKFIVIIIRLKKYPQNSKYSNCITDKRKSEKLDKIMEKTCSSKNSIVNQSKAGLNFVCLNWYNKNKPFVMWCCHVICWKTIIKCVNKIIALHVKPVLQLVVFPFALSISCLCCYLYCILWTYLYCY